MCVYEGFFSETLPTCSTTASMGWQNQLHSEKLNESERTHVDLIWKLTWFSTLFLCQCWLLQLNSKTSGILVSCAAVHLVGQGPSGCRGVTIWLHHASCFESQQESMRAFPPEMLQRVPDAPIEPTIHFVSWRYALGLFLVFSNMRTMWTTTLFVVAIFIKHQGLQTNILVPNKPTVHLFHFACEILNTLFNNSQTSLLALNNLFPLFSISHSLKSEHA